MIIDAWYDLSVVLADPAAQLIEVLRDWRCLDDRVLDHANSELRTADAAGRGGDGKCPEIAPPIIDLS